jgi:inosine/guanosine/xanthosine phosphorylase family protein
LKNNHTYYIIPVEGDGEKMLTPKDVDVSYRYLRRKCELKPEVALVHGSGIPRPAFNIVCEVPIAEVPHLTKPTVEGHRGAFAFGHSGDVPVVLADGRLHLYEGIPADVATLPLRLFARLGCRTVILTGSVGSLREALAPGNVAVVRDHVNLAAASPFAGRHYDEFGPRFVAGADAYDADLRERAEELAEPLGFMLKNVVYVGVPGPQFETAAEAHALAVLGGDVVGMSVPNEVLVARQAGLRVLALCAVTNVAGRAASHDGVLLGADEPGLKIKTLLEALLPTLAGK